jgi:predicted nucleic acid-binding protein
MPDIVLDSSVLIASLIPSDKFHAQGDGVVEDVLSGERTAFTSVVVPVEVCGVIARRTGDKKQGQDAERNMARWVQLGVLRLVELDDRRMAKAQQLAVELSLRGMDAIVAQVGEETELPLLTFDDELALKASRRLKVMTHRDTL